jgi:hypothetical protein
MTLTKSQKEFYCGFALAIGTVIRGGCESSGVDAMDSNGVTLEDLIAAGADLFDLEPISAEYKLQGRRQDGHKLTLAEHEALEEKP